MYYDIEKITANMNVYDVALHIGMEVYPRCGKYYIHCPGHIDRLGKSDNVANNAILTENGYHCFACNQSVNVFTMVQEYYKNVLGSPITFSKALEIVADSCGGSQLYALSDKVYKKNKEEKLNEFILSRNELKLIGISINTNNKSIISYNDEYLDEVPNKACQEKRYYWDEKINNYKSEYIHYIRTPYSIYSFYNEDPFGCVELLHQKTKEKLEYLKNKLSEIELYSFNNKYCDDNTLIQTMKELLLKDYNSCEQIQDKLYKHDNIKLIKPSNNVLYENLYELNNISVAGPF